MWHVDAEIISLIFVLVLLVDIFKSNVVNALKDKLFKGLAVTTALAIMLDIISSAAMINYKTSSWWLIQISLIIYFILTPMLSMLWQLYAIVVVSKTAKHRNGLLLITAIPFVTYVVLVCSNPWTGCLFNLSAVNEYTRGTLFNSMYVVFYGYSIATLLLSFHNFKKIERTTNIVLTTFPLIAGMGVFLQQLLPGYLITGAAFTLVLIVTYMFLQNRKTTRDHLTGLNNRMSFSMEIEKISNGSEHGFVLTVAVDDFKLFNQTFGQEKGDMLLCQLADYFVGISPNNTAYRYGGDIFTLILKKSNEQEALTLANRIIERFAQSFYMDQVAYSVSTCIGVVEYPDKSIDKNHSIVTAMDFAIYQAKKRGKGQIAFFNEELVMQFKRKHEVADALTNAIKNQTFEVYIQPIYHTKMKKFLFAESLLRLNDEKLGAISPAEFISIAEETGQIVEITYFVLEKVCAFIHDNRSILGDKVSFSVNFSVIQFMQKNLEEKVKAIIERYEIPPQLIKIEITESVIADSFEDIKTSMLQLNEYGISFALDDYGQGYSNISYLINLPFSSVKLDKSIIDHIVADKKFISVLIPMFQSLNKIIISEGVETKAQAEILKELHCDAIQGYYFARPMPMDKALELFKKDKNTRLQAQE